MYFLWTIIFFIITNYTLVCHNDYPEPWQLFFQDPATPIMEGIINFHNDIISVLIFIFCVVSVVLIWSVIWFGVDKYNPTTHYFGLVHHARLEYVWTVIPCIILSFIAIPSFNLIFSLDDIITPEMTVKIIGHQWYWTYEYGEIADDNTILIDPRVQSPKTFDSYIITEDNLEIDFNSSLLEQKLLRLLEVDNHLILPLNKSIRLLITSADVLHSWSVPSLGVKMDACPGRLNQVGLFINRPGVFYGQCSEICGTNHGFMPIVVEVV